MPINGLKRFEGRIVLVTGAASGIGKATARRFVHEGATVLFVDTNKDTLTEATEGLPPEQVATSVTDISAPEQVEALFEKVQKQFGKLDILVNNAGTTAMGTVLQSSFEDWQKVRSTVLDGTVAMSRTALPLLIRSKGNIVNTASVSGIGGDWNTPYYDAAKGGVVMLTKAMALDHGKDGVRINAICPSVTLTAMTDDLKDNKEYQKALNARAPLGRMGEPEEMAAAILFLASDDATFITGLIMPVDGGTSASNGQPPFPNS